MIFFSALVLLTYDYQSGHISSIEVNGIKLHNGYKRLKKILMYIYVCVCVCVAKVEID